MKKKNFELTLTLTLVLTLALLLTGTAYAGSLLPTFPPHEEAILETPSPSPDTAAAPASDDKASLLDFDGYALSLLGRAPQGDSERQALEAMYGYYEAIGSLETEFAAVLNKSGTQDYQALMRLMEFAEDCEDVLERFEDVLKASYRAGSIERETYRALSQELDHIDDRFDDIEDYFDDDDDDDDYDDYDDDDD